MRSQLFLPWLAIATAVTAQATSFADDISEARDALASEDYDAQVLYDDPEIDTSLDGYDHESVARDLRESQELKRAPLEVRDALADEAINMIHEYGQDVDISLDGYDHDAVVRDLEEGPLEKVERGLGFEAARRLGRMKPHYVVHSERDEDLSAEDDADSDGAEEDEGPWVDLDSVDGEEGAAKRDADDSDNEGDGLEDDGDTPLVTLERDADSDDAPSASARDFEEGDADEMDNSLEGYDGSLLDRDSEYEYYDANEAFHDGAYDTGEENSDSGQSVERDADDKERVVQKGPPSQRRRDLVDEDLGEEEDGAISNAWSTVRRWIDDMMYG